MSKKPKPKKIQICKNAVGIRVTVDGKAVGFIYNNKTGVISLNEPLL